MERLTHEADFGIDDCEQTLYEVPSDKEGLYNIYDIAFGYSQNEDEKYHEECEEILKNISLKLKHYEDLVEQGRLIELPCKVGDTIYEIKEYRTKCHCNYTFDEYNCEGCYEDYCDSERAYKIVEYKAYNISNITELLRLNKIGKTVFLTKEEAEQALAERNE